MSAITTRCVMYKLFHPHFYVFIPWLRSFRPRDGVERTRTAVVHYRVLHLQFELQNEVHIPVWWCHKLISFEKEDHVLGDAMCTSTSRREITFNCIRWREHHALNRVKCKLNFSRKFGRRFWSIVLSFFFNISRKAKEIKRM